MELRRRIKDLIDDNDTTQKRLAERFHVSESTMSTYMTGKYRMPAWCVKEFAEYFHVSTDYLYGLTDLPQPPMALSEGEQDMIRRFRTLSREQRELIVKNIAIMQKQNET